MTSIIKKPSDDTSHIILAKVWVAIATFVPFMLFKINNLNNIENIPETTNVNDHGNSNDGLILRNVLLLEKHFQVLHH